MNLTNLHNDSEVVFGIICPTGTDTSEAINYMIEHLKKFEYSVKVINISSEVIPKFYKDNELEPDDEYERINFLMDKGNEIRGTGDNNILMEGALSIIFEDREMEASPKKRVAYIIKSIKHPEEASFLRKVYGVGFHLVGITSSYEAREKNLTERKNIEVSKATELLNRDRDESLENGQHTEDVFQNADYFIVVNNDKDNLRYSIYRLVDLLFGHPYLTPTFDEFAMFMAYSSSLRSADLSRQIGAVITKDHEIISSGANDCPKVNGGLYWPYLTKSGKYDDYKESRDYTLKCDSNKMEQKKIIDKIIESLEIENNDETVKKIKSSGIGSLTEYGRVVHAEMEALLMCARNNISSRGGTLYATTFPCHNCAKHIIAAGIKKVVYIEPYPKSKALEFYKQEVTQNEEESIDGEKVLFTHFYGVGPRRFIDLFSVSSSFWNERKRKDSFGNTLEWKEGNASLRTPLSVFNYLDAEKSAANRFQNVLKIAVKGGSTDG